MNKKILATAVAVAVSGGMTMSSSAYAGQSAVDGLYGKIRLGVNSAAELDVVSSKLVFGFKGAHDLDNGLEFSYGIEFEHDGADKESPGTGQVTVTTGFVTADGTATPASAAVSTGTGNSLSNDVSYVALSGGFGKVIAGEHADFAGWACSGTDLFTFGTDEACSLVHDTRIADAVQYRYSSGAINFGFAYVMDGSGENPTHVGIQWAGDNFGIGAVLVSAGDTAGYGGGVGPGIPAGEEGTQIGGHYTFGNITLGVTIADNGQPTAEDATSVALQIPLAGGNFAILSTTGDALDTIAGDSIDVEWAKSLGGGAYWGLQFIDDDLASDSEFIAYLGINF